MRKIRILLIEDNRLLRDGIKAILNKQPDLRSCGIDRRKSRYSSEGTELETSCGSHRSGITKRKWLACCNDADQGISANEDHRDGSYPFTADIVEFVKAGAAGFILKDATIEDVLETIRAVVRGMKILPPMLMGTLFSHVVELALRKGQGKIVRRRADDKS